MRLVKFISVLTFSIYNVYKSYINNAISQEYEQNTLKIKQDIIEYTAVVFRSLYIELCKEILALEKFLFIDVATNYTACRDYL